MIKQAYSLPANRVVYNFRYFLPYFPVWGSEVFCRKRLDELLIFCRKARIDAVQFYVNTLPSIYYMPARNAQEQKQWANWMGSEIAMRLKEEGISYQLNLQMLLGATTYGVDMRDQYDWDFMVNQHGETSLGCACPISQKFRKIMGPMLSLWADTFPDVIWIDDDFRLHNHGMGKRGMDFYCYCPQHLYEFSKRVGLKYRRDSLVRAILASGKENSVRREWLDFLNESMNECAAWVREQIHQSSPNIRVAQMTSAPDIHSIEGRDWKTFLKALSGIHRPMVRPCSGIYTGTTVPVKDHVITYRLMAQSMHSIDKKMKCGSVDYAPELENTRYTTWSKSVSSTKYVLELGQLLGCPQITLATHDLEGSPLCEEPSTEKLLKKSKTRLQCIADLKLDTWIHEGVAFINDSNAAYSARTVHSDKMNHLVPERLSENLFLSMGVPAYYISPDEIHCKKHTIILDSFFARSMTDGQIKKILESSVFLDGAATDILCQRGFKKYLGVCVEKAQTHGIMSEIYHEGIIDEVYACRTPHRGTHWYSIKNCGAQKLSSLLEPGGHLNVGCTLFKNSLGGRVVVYPCVGDFKYGVFGSHARLRWLHGVLKWLNRGTLSVLPLIPHHGLSIVCRRKNERLFAFANLGTDELQKMSWKKTKKCDCGQYQILSKNGKWEEIKLDDQNDFLTFQYRLQTFEWLILRCFFKPKTAI